MPLAKSLVVAATLLEAVGASSGAGTITESLLGRQGARGTAFIGTIIEEGQGTHLPDEP